MGPLSKHLNNPCQQVVKLCWPFQVDQMAGIRKPVPDGVEQNVFEEGICFAHQIVIVVTGHQ